MNGITLACSLNKITTTRDGGWLVTFETGQDEKDAILALSEYRTGLLQLAVIPIGEQSIPSEVDQIDLEDLIKDNSLTTGNKE